MGTFLKKKENAVDQPAANSSTATYEEQKSEAIRIMQENDWENFQINMLRKDATILYYEASEYRLLNEREKELVNIIGETNYSLIYAVSKFDEVTFNLFYVPEDKGSWEYRSKGFTNYPVYTALRCKNSYKVLTNYLKVNTEDNPLGSKGKLMFSLVEENVLMEINLVNLGDSETITSQNVEVDSKTLPEDEAIFRMRKIEVLKKNELVKQFCSSSNSHGYGLELI